MSTSTTTRDRIFRCCAAGLLAAAALAGTAAPAVGATSGGALTPGCFAPILDAGSRLTVALHIIEVPGATFTDPPPGCPAAAAELSYLDLCIIEIPGTTVDHPAGSPCA